MKTITFNTGRKYTAHGQRIVATLHDDGVVTFFDHDRNVDGEFPLSQWQELTQQLVMDWYDHGRAPNTRRSWADGMMRGGVNTLK